MGLSEKHAGDSGKQTPALSCLSLPRPAFEAPAREQDSYPMSRSAAVDDFAEFLRRFVPIAFIPRELSCYIHRESNTRLGMARAAGVELDHLTIGEDCLPTWPGLYWDPDVESLHSAIQNRLVDFQVSRDLGDLVLGEIVTKGNLKLAEARELGVELKDMIIGPNLLPTWDAAQNSPEDNEALVVDEYEADSEAITSQMDDTSLAAPSGGAVITPVTDICDSGPFPAPRSGSSLSTCNDDSDSSDDYDDMIALNNFVSPQASYEDGQVANIVYGVEVVGGPAVSSEVDLEVYLVEDDDSVADLPEVELAIDRAAFEHYYDDDEAVDVEIPGVQLFCFDGIEEAVSDDGEPSDEQSTQLPANPRPLFHVQEVIEDDDANTSPHSKKLTAYDEAEEPSEEDEAAEG